ncbi:hypothetical protein [Agrobacterium vitis]|uniref:hypothetical protein n=1 Tax=Agrobacterium vitis TaxID=373 RepID=UPI001F2AAA43|nr:hypothetical protein [Agrobacterium vitis]
MADYNVWADLFRTWQSTSDWIKAVAIVTPPAFAMGALALLLRYRLAAQQNLSRTYHLLEPPQHSAQPPEMIGQHSYRCRHRSSKPIGGSAPHADATGPIPGGKSGA